MSVSPVTALHTCLILVITLSPHHLLLSGMPAAPEAPGSHQKVCFRIMHCSSSHVFLASAVLPFPASTTAGGYSRKRPTRTTESGLLLGKECRRTCLDTLLRSSSWSCGSREGQVGHGLLRRRKTINTSNGQERGQRSSPWPGGVRLTACARAASTDCSASPRRNRPLRDLERAVGAQWPAPSQSSQRALFLPP